MKLEKTNVYDEMGDFWWREDNPLRIMNAVRFEYFHGAIGNLKKLSVLDVGCGGGLLSEEFAKKEANVTGIDISENSIAVARAHVVKSNLNIEYLCCSAEDIPIRNRTFDAVVCADCLEHVNDPGKVIQEISRLLKPAGTFCYLTINRTIFSFFIMSFFENMLVRYMFRDFFKGLQGRKGNLSKTKITDHEWKKFIKPEELYRLMNNHGITNVETKGVMFGWMGGKGIRFKIGNNIKIAYLGCARKI